jgi:hypothetical protein
MVWERNLLRSFRAWCCAIAVSRVDQMETIRAMSTCKRRAFSPWRVYTEEALTERYNQSRRTRAKILKGWKTLIVQQDENEKLVSMFFSRQRSRQITSAIYILAKWKAIARKFHHVRALFSAVSSRDRRRCCLAASHAWRSHFHRKLHLNACFIHLQKRHRAKTIRRCMQKMRHAYKRNAIVRAILRHTDGSRRRQLAARVLDNWHCECSNVRALLEAAMRVLELQRVSRSRVTVLFVSMCIMPFSFNIHALFH